MTEIDRTYRGRRVEFGSSEKPITKLKRGDEGTYQYTELSATETRHIIKWDNGAEFIIVGEHDGFTFID